MINEMNSKQISKPASNKNDVGRHFTLEWSLKYFIEINGSLLGCNTFEKRRQMRNCCLQTGQWHLKRETYARCLYGHLRPIVASDKWALLQCCERKTSNKVAAVVVVCDNLDGNFFVVFCQQQQQQQRQPEVAKQAALATQL